MLRYVSALAAALVLSCGCAGERSVSEAPHSPEATSSSSLCQAIVDQFVALPAGLDRTPAGSAPSLGRWWVRRCVTEAKGEELRVRLEGPGWYWVDRDDDSFHVRQHVHFRVHAELVGRFRPGVSWHQGVVSLWFQPTGADVDVEPLGEIEPTADNFVMGVLQQLAMPLPRYNVEAQAARQFDDEATLRFQRALTRGYTLVYDVEHGQPDFALDLLAPGKLPLRPFDDGRSWLANERMVLASGAPHVLGPFAATDELSLDVRIRSGTGLAYRAVCAPDLRRAFEVAEQGQAGRVPMTEIVDTGQVRGTDSARLHIPDCGFYLVISALAEELTEADVRVRA
jgi:hypothetical protein